jgi:hypothetical protein
VAISGVFYEPSVFVYRRWWRLAERSILGPVYIRAHAAMEPRPWATKVDLRTADVLITGRHSVKRQSLCGGSGSLSTTRPASSPKSRRRLQNRVKLAV